MAWPFTHFMQNLALYGAIRDFAARVDTN